MYNSLVLLPTPTVGNFHSGCGPHQRSIARLHIWSHPPKGIHELKIKIKLHSVECLGRPTTAGGGIEAMV